MLTGIASEDAMVAIGVIIFFEILVGLYKCLRIFEGVLWMHIVISRAMTNEQRAMQAYWLCEWGWCHSR